MNDVEDMNKRLQKFDDFTTGDINNIEHPARELASNIIDLFEDFLDAKGIKIPNKEKEGNEEEAILYGDDCYEIEDEITEMIVNRLKGD